MSARPAFPNSATVHVPERLVLRGGAWRQIDLAVRYGLFDHASGRCLVDTGYSARVIAGRRSPELCAYAALIRPRLEKAALPAHAPNVSTILITHFHADHVSALLDYPDARIVADGEALDALLTADWFARVRCGFFSELLPADLRARLVRLEHLPLVEAPLGLGPARDVFGDGQVLAVPLPGHMRGHTGYLWAGPERPLLYAADAQWLRRAVMEDRQPGPPACWIMHDAEVARATARRIAEFARSGGEVVFCHEPVE